MLIRSRLAPIAIVGVLVMLATAASAHVAIGSGPAFAGGNAVLTFSVGHGCEGADTTSINVRIPEGITSVRGVPNTFGPADVQVDDGGLPTNVVWTKDAVRDADDQYYQMHIRLGVPDMPFTVMHFAILQTCKDSEGVEYMTDWAALPGDEPDENGDELPPAAQLVILPKRAPGWNKYTVPSTVTDLATFFGDAEIVWSGDKAYSANAAIAELIEAEDDVDTLEEIAADAEIWVKY